jgi:hypothetical protein
VALRRTESDALYEILESLPLMDDMFLRMQCQNVALVNAHVIDVEREMYRKYIEQDRTPVLEALFTSALSQMWTFAFYELMRTWRQRVQELLTHADRFAAGQVEKIVIPDAAHVDVNFAFLCAQARAEEDCEFLDQLRNVRETFEPVFRELEGVRVTLAKHEIPKGGGGKAANAGYARIDPVSGSMNYLFTDNRGNSNMCSRHSIVRHVFNAFGVADDNC